MRIYFLVAAMLLAALASFGLGYLVGEETLVERMQLFARSNYNCRKRLHQLEEDRQRGGGKGSRKRQGVSIRSGTPSVTICALSPSADRRRSDELSIKVLGIIHDIA